METRLGDIKVAGLIGKTMAYIVIPMILSYILCKTFFPTDFLIKCEVAFHHIFYNYSYTSNQNISSGESVIFLIILMSSFIGSLTSSAFLLEASSTEKRLHGSNFMSRILKIISFLLLIYVFIIILVFLGIFLVSLPYKQTFFISLFILTLYWITIPIVFLKKRLEIKVEKLPIYLDLLDSIAGIVIGISCVLFLVYYIVLFVNGIHLLTVHNYAKEIMLLGFILFIPSALDTIFDIIKSFIILVFS